MHKPTPPHISGGHGYNLSSSITQDVSSATPNNETASFNRRTLISPTTLLSTTSELSTLSCRSSLSQRSDRQQGRLASPTLTSTLDCRETALSLLSSPISTLSPSPLLSPSPPPSKPSSATLSPSLPPTLSPSFSLQNQHVTSPLLSLLSDEEEEVNNRANNHQSTTVSRATTPTNMSATGVVTSTKQDDLTSDLSKSFDEIQSELKKVLDNVEQGNLLEAFETLSSITDAVVTNCETLGLTSDEPPYTMIDRDGFWQGLNQCWLFSLSHCGLAKSEEERLAEQHLYYLRDLVVAWCDVLEKFGLVDYEMGFWEQDILTSIDAGLNAVRLKNGVVEEPGEDQSSELTAADEDKALCVGNRVLV